MLRLPLPCRPRAALSRALVLVVLAALLAQVGDVRARESAGGPTGRPQAPADEVLPRRWSDRAL